MTIMKTFRLFSMAAMAIAMASCSNDDNVLEQQPAQQQGTMHFTATIAAPNSGATTRTTYNETGDGYINVAWKEGDEIALVHGGVKDVVTVGIPNSDGSAPISGTITVGTDEEDVVLVYPADAVGKPTGGTGGTGFSNNPIYWAKVHNQDGTLEYIQNNIDFRKGVGKLAVSGALATASLKESVSMPSMIAIWKLTLQDDATPTPNALAATGVTVSVNGIPVARATSAAKSTYYLCMVPSYMVDSHVNASGDGLTIDATVGSDTYRFTKAGVSLTEGLFYQSTLTMASLLKTPLTLKALTDGKIKVTKPKNGMQYSLNGGTKTDMNGGTTEIPVEAGDKVRFYGNGTSITSYNGTTITGTAWMKVYGNIMSLVDENNFATTAAMLSSTNAFKQLFYNNVNLIDASGLLLPATELTRYCYCQMFYGCTKLTMAPELPAKTLDTGCYTAMFNDCKRLTAAPELPATTLADFCYDSMFTGCSSLTSVTCLATSGINSNKSTDSWLLNVAYTGTFIAASTAVWPDGNNGIPSNWTRLNPDGTPYVAP